MSLSFIAVVSCLCCKSALDLLVSLSFLAVVSCLCSNALAKKWQFFREKKRKRRREKGGGRTKKEVFGGSSVQCDNFLSTMYDETKVR